MTTLTGTQIANTYKQLLQVGSGNVGLTGSLQTVQDGDASNSPLQLSNSAVNINGTFQLRGVTLTASASTLNAVADLSGVTGLVAVSAGNVYGRTLTEGTGITISNGTGTEGNPTIGLSTSGITVSLAGIKATSATFAETVSAAFFVGDGSRLTNVASDTDGTIKFITAGTGVNFTINGAGSATIPVSGTVNINTNQSFGIVSATNIDADELLMAGVSAANVTEVAAVSVLTKTNLNAITSINSVIGDGTGFVTDAELAATSVALATSIGNSNTNIVAVSALTSVNLAAITSINSVIGDGSGFVTDAELAATSVALATSIGNSNTRITSVSNFAVALSATMATSIGNSNTNITTNTNAITSINSVIGDGTGFVTDAELAATSVALATSIGNSNTNITTNTNAITSINSVIGDGTGFVTDAELAATSVALATSIGNSNTRITSVSNFAVALSATLATSIGNSNTNITTNINAITSINSVIGDGTGFATDAELAAVSATLATSIANSNTNITNNTSAITSITNLNTQDVTLAGTPDYINISNQVITRNQIDLTTDVTGNLPITNLNTGTGASGTSFWRGDGVWATPSGSGDVAGPASATDNAVVRFDATTGKLIQNSTVIISDAGVVSTGTNANLELDPNGSGKVVFKGNATKGSGQFVLNCEQNSHGVTLKGPPHSAAASYTLTLPNDDGNANQVLKTDGSGTLAWVDQGNVTLAGSLNYLTISGQTITQNAIDLSTDTTGTLAIASGGTGATSASAARVALSAAASGANSDITSLTGLTTDLTVAQGGTGASTFTANGLLVGNGTGAVTATAVGTSGQVLTSNGSGVAPTFQTASSGGATDIDGLSDGVTNSSGATVGLGTDALANDDGSNRQNTALGFNALKTTNSNKECTAVGYKAGTALTGTGDVNFAKRNSFFGFQAGLAITTGLGNTIIGAGIAPSATTAENITAIGKECAESVTTGNGVFIGASGGYTTTTGQNVAIIGNGAAASSATVSNEITLGDANITKFRIPGINWSIKDTPATDNYVLTVDANGEAGWEAAGGGGASDIDGLSDGITNSSGVTVGLGTGALAADDGTANQNTALGYQALNATNSNFYCTAIGHQAGKAAVAGARDLTLVGHGAGKSITTAGKSTYIGSGAGQNNTTGTGFNTAVGTGAGESITTGWANTMLGTSAGYTTTTSRNVICIGNAAEASSATVDHEITLGDASITKFRIPGINWSIKDTTATENYILTVDANGEAGWEANAGSGATDINGLSDGVTNSSGATVGLGTGALANDDGTANNNTALGYNALNATNSNLQCTAIGYRAGKAAVAGANSLTLLGAYAGNSITTASGNTYIGAQAGQNNTTGNGSNIAVGSGSGEGITTGYQNVMLGNSAGYTTTTSRNVICIGNGALASSATVDHEITLGDTSITKFRIPGINFIIKDSTATDNYVLTVDANGEAGWEAGGATDINGLSDAKKLNTSTYGIGALAFNAMSASDDGGNNLAIGYQAGGGTDSNGSNKPSGNTFIGSSAGYGVSQTGTTHDCVAVGYRALYLHQGVSGSVLVGRSAGENLSTGLQNVGVGLTALTAATTANLNTGVGTYSGRAITSGIRNTLLGYASGQNITTGSNNIVIGVAIPSSATVSNEITLGDDNITKFRIPGINWSIKDTTATDNYVLTVDANGEAGWEAAAGGASDINDLSDAITNSSGGTVGLGTGALANDDGSANSNTALGYQALNSTNSNFQNTAVGYQAGKVAVAGSRDLTLVGHSAGQSITTATRATFIGSQAGKNNTTGNGGNTAIGAEAGENITTGYQNVMLGNSAGYSTTTSRNVICIGNAAIASSATVDHEITLGDTSITKFRIPGINWSIKDTTATDNYVLTVDANGEAGWEAGGATDINGLSDALTNGSLGSTIGIGTGALAADDGSDNYNTAVGFNALNDITSGNHNVALGYYAGGMATTGIYNTYLGAKTGSSNEGTSTGNYNTAVGALGLGKITTGANNTTSGWNSGYRITTGQNNTLSGNTSGQKITTGGNNTAIGTNSLYNVTTGNTNTALGYNAGYTSTGSNCLMLGNLAYASSASVDNEITLGNDSITKFRIPGINWSIKDTTATEDYVLTVDANGEAGWEAAGGGASDIDGLSDGKTFNSGQTIGLGTGAAAAVSGSATLTAVGYNAGNDSTSAILSTYIGYTTGEKATGSRNTFIGATICDQGSADGTRTGSNNTVVGCDSLRNLTTGYSNSFLGHAMGEAMTTGYKNTGMGQVVLNALTTGILNTFYGYGAGAKITTGSQNCGFGSGALKNMVATTYAYNHAFGTESGRDITTGVRNAFFGGQAGNNTTTGSNQVIIGDLATASSATVSNEITLGDNNITTLRCQVQSISSLSDRRDKKDIEELPLGVDFINTLKPVKFTWNMRDGAKVGVKEAGFIAQDLDEAQIDADAEDYLSLVLKNNPEKLEASYGKLVPVLVKAVQELSAEISNLKKEIENGK